MPNVTFNAPIPWNPFSAGGFDPASLITDPTVTVIGNTAEEWVIEKTMTVPGFPGEVPVRLTLRPAAGQSFTPGAGLPAGVVDSIVVQANVFGSLVTAASITAMAGLGLEAAGITSGALLFGSDDTFTGSTGNDLFNTGFGDDELNGGGGNDVLLAGAGDDELNGGNGDDVLSGDGVGINGDAPAGNDRLNGGAGADFLYGGGGADVFIYGVGQPSAAMYDTTANRFLGDTIMDFATGEDQIDLTDASGSIITAVFGSSTFVYIDDASDGVAGEDDNLIVVYNASVSGTDLLIGDRGLTMYGAEGADTLNGSENNDVIVGGAGADSLSGEGGGDWIYLGASDGAADTVAFNADDSVYSLIDATGAGADKIVDFEAGIDTLSFAGIGGNNTLLIQTFGDDSYVYVDLASDGTWDMTVIVIDEIITEADVDMGQAQATPALGLDPASALDLASGLGGHRFEDLTLVDGWRGGWLF